MSVLNIIVDNQLHFAFVQYTLIFFIIYIWGNIQPKKKYFLGATGCVLFFTVMCVFLSIFTTGFIWLSGVFLTFICIKKMNFALLLPSSAILLYILITYVTGDILLLFLNSRQITDTLLLIASSIFYLLCALVLRQVLKSIIQRVNISQKLIWLSTILSSLTFISYFVIIAIERLTDEESAMGKANSFFIMGKNETLWVIQVKNSGKKWLHYIHSPVPSSRRLCSNKDITFRVAISGAFVDIHQGPSKESE